MQRVNKIIPVIGRRGSGKTTFTLNLIAQYLQSANFDKIIIFDTTDHHAYSAYPIIEAKYLPAVKSGVVRVLVDDTRIEHAMSIVKKSVRNTVLILEDAGKYITGTIDNELKNVLLDTKQKNIDTILQFHGVGDVPPSIFRYSDSVFLFKINDDLNTYKGKIPNFAEFKLAYNEVMQHPSPYFVKRLYLN
jgi:Ni2+-binding GTPase involved in maturation of urease and hydrogenase